MQSESAESLDVDELLQLTLRAMDQKDYETALGYLKRLLAIGPDHAAAVFLMGGIHAELGLYDRALEEMTRAVELDPELHIGHFQRGMLHVRAARYQEAVDAWAPLTALGPEHPLFLFSRGIRLIMEGKPREGVVDLEKGIALNLENAPLNADMARLKAATEEEIERVSSDGAPVTAEAAAAGRQMLISRYQGAVDSES